MKRIIVILLVLVMAFSLVACEKSESTEPDDVTLPVEAEAEVEDAKEEIVLGLAWAVMDDGMTNLTNGIKAHLDNGYPDYDISYTLTSADGSIATLISDVESLIALNPDMIYIMNSVGDSGIIPALQACNEAGIPVGIGVKVDTDEYTYLYEGFDQYSCGLMQAEYMNAFAAENPDRTFNVAYVLGDAGNTASDARRNGFVENFVDTNDNASIVVEANCDYVTDTAQATVEDWLIAFDEINVIACANDDMAQGAINACVAAGREDIIILGIDGGDIGISNVKSGAQAMTCAISFSGVAGGCARAMVDCALGNLDTNLVSLGTENLVIITGENVDEY